MSLRCFITRKLGLNKNHTEIGSFLFIGLHDLEFLFYNSSKLHTIAFQVSIMIISIRFDCLFHVSKWILNSSLISFVGVKKFEMGENRQREKEIINFWTHDFFSIYRRVDFWPFFMHHNTKKKSTKGLKRERRKVITDINLRSFSAFFKKAISMFQIFSARKSTPVKANEFLLDSEWKFYCFSMNCSKIILGKNEKDHVKTQTRSQDFCLQSHSAADSSGFLYSLYVFQLF